MTKEENKIYIGPVAIQVLEEMEMGTVFSGYDFKKLVSARCQRAKKSHVASIMRLLWDYRLSGKKKCSFICIDASKSLYKKISLIEWRPMEKALLAEKKEKEIEKSIRILEENGYEVKIA